MRCDSFLDRWDMLDAGEEPGFFLKLHLAGCPECRARVEALDRTLAAYRAARPCEKDAAAAEAVEERVMAAVNLMPRPHRELRARDWAVAGFAIMLSMAMIPFDRNFSVIKELFGTSYALPLSLVLGLVMAGYGAVFIGTHMDELGPLVRRWASRR
jgi:anti-sigma factor RsiW